MMEFSAEADADFADCVSQFIRDGKKKLILDLRDNGGGNLLSLEYVAQYLSRQSDCERIADNEPYKQRRLRQRRVQYSYVKQQQSACPARGNILADSVPNKQTG